MDPILHLKKGEEALTQALIINPAMSFAYNTLGNLHCCAGEDAFETGRDPGPAFQEALKAFSKLHELNKDFPPGFYNEGLVHLDLARVAVAQWKSAAPELKAADKAFETALKASPDYANAYVKRAALRCLEARSALLENKSTEAYLGVAEKDLNRAVKLTPDHPEIPQSQSEIGLLRTWALLSRKGDPSTSLNATQEALGRCLAQSPKDPDFLRLSAQAHWLRALHYRRKGEDASVAQRTGLAEAEQSIAINRRVPSAQMLRGLLLRLDPATRTKGDAEIRTAIQRNPFLKREADAFIALMGTI